MTEEDWDCLESEDAKTEVYEDDEARVKGMQYFKTMVQHLFSRIRCQIMVRWIFSVCNISNTLVQHLFQKHWFNIYFQTIILSTYIMLQISSIGL